MTDVVKMPSAKVLANLARRSNEAKAKAAGITGGMGQEIAEAVDKHNVHAAAFKMCTRLMRMDAIKLMSFLTHFDDYREKLGIDKLVAPDLPGMDGDKTEEEPKPETSLADAMKDAIDADTQPAGNG
jgi:hypothetical protein